NENIPKRLIDAGADITSDVGINSFLATINLGKNNLVKYMIEKGVDVNKKSRGNKTSLIVAIDKGDEEIVKELIENGADVNMPGKTVEKFDSEQINLMSLLSPTPPQKPLIFAIEKGNEVIINTLIEHGADVNIKNGEGYSTLMLSIVGNKESVVKCLLEHGVDTSVKS
ncbi:ankyrin, partial [Anaeromyces robustus]